MLEVFGQGANVPKCVRGFIDRLEREDHFQRHGGEFMPKFPSAEDYEAAAIAFLTGPLRGKVMECVRRNGDVIRFDPTTDEFAICDRDGVLRTYYRPSPTVHKRPDNIAYFKEQCLK